MEGLETLKKWIADSRSIVFFGGAGTSTESGIKDFRSEDGLYSTDFHGYRPEDVLSHQFLMHHYDLFLKYVTEVMAVDHVQPNAGHKALVRLEKQGKLSAVITQNIDGLHQKAGSSNVLELHGTLARWYCTGCRREEAHHFQCDCGHGIVRPDVTLYGEMLNDRVVEAAISAIRKADLMIVCGTSLTVYPAAMYLQYYQGNRMVIINRTPTDFDRKAGLLIAGSFAEVMSQVVE